jgi:prealbumin domain-containing protein
MEDLEGVNELSPLFKSQFRRLRIKISLTFTKAVVAGFILTLLLFTNLTMSYSIIGHSYAKKTTPTPNLHTRSVPSTILPSDNQNILPNPGPSPIPPPGLLGTLKIGVKVSGGDKSPSDFSITVSGNNPNPSSFAGSSSGTSVTLQAGKYSVSSSNIDGYTTTYSSGCSGSISEGKDTNSCTITNKYTSPPGSTTFLNVITQVDNTNGGTKSPSDFSITVSGNNPSPSSFSGSTSGTSVSLKAGNYNIVTSPIPGYTTTYSSGCSGTAIGGLVKCTITNRYSGLPPGSTTFLNVITQVDNTNGGTNKPSDFTISVSGNTPKPSSFPGSSSGTSVKLLAGKYSVSGSSIPGYTTTYSSGCSGDASGGLIKCTITNKYTVIGSLTFLNVITSVDNTNGGTKSPSDFSITVSGNNPRPSSFTGSSSGTTVTLQAGKYSVSSSNIDGYTTTYSSGCSGTAKGGTPINCTITHLYSPRIGRLVVTTTVDNSNGGT